MHHPSPRLGRTCLLGLSFAVLLTACNNPPPPPEKLPESCDNLAAQYLKCIPSTEPNEAAISSLKSQIVLKCEAKLAQQPTTTDLISCTNTPCELMDVCLLNAEQILQYAHLEHLFTSLRLPSLQLLAAGAIQNLRQTYKETLNKK